MEKLRRVLSGQDEEEQGLAAQVTSRAAATAGGRAANRRLGDAGARPGLAGPPLRRWGLSRDSPLLRPCPWSLQRARRYSARGSGCQWPTQGFHGSASPCVVSDEVIMNEIRAGTSTRVERGAQM